MSTTDHNTNKIRFLLNGETTSVTNADPTQSVLYYLRENQRLSGTKEGCAEGDCGASAYCGVIGSRTKGLKFRQRLLNKGFSQDELKQLTCPMGLADLKTKKPMEIAVSVMAECLVLREKQQLSHNLFETQLDTDNGKIISFENRD